MNQYIKNLTHVIFDFDYTLADSSLGVFSCVNYALSKLEFPSTTYEKSSQTIGLSLGETYASLTGKPAREADEFIRLLIEQADNVMVEKTILFKYTHAVVWGLKQLDLRLAIVSTKFRYRIEKILERESLLSCFDVIIGGEDVAIHKPNPESLLLAVEKLGAKKRDILYVGDSIIDAKAAQNAAIPFVLVLSGVTPAEAFDQFPGLEILKDIRGLPKLIDNWVQSY